MKELLERIALCIEKGKVDINSPHPPDMQGQDGADELTEKALKSGIAASEILSKGLIAGMQKVGKKFRDGEIYLPDVLMSAKSMTSGMKHLKPYFMSGEVKHKGKIVMGTVTGDLHDIGKKIVAMFFEGGGWEVIDLGVDVSAERFVQAIEEHKPLAVGLSALLTTTMVSMESARDPGFCGQDRSRRLFPRPSRRFGLSKRYLSNIRFIERSVLKTESDLA